MQLMIAAAPELRQTACAARLPVANAAYRLEGGYLCALPMPRSLQGGALLCDMMLGAVAGGSIPLIFRALGRDPAQASSIFLTTITDGAGFFIFLGMATLFIF